LISTPGLSSFQQAAHPELQFNPTAVRMKQAAKSEQMAAENALILLL